MRTYKMNDHLTISRPNLLQKEMFSWIISFTDLLENSYVEMGVPFTPISLRLFEI